MKIIQRLLLIVLLFIFILTVILFTYAITPITLDTRKVLITENSNMSSIAEQLMAQGVLENKWCFILLARLLNKDNKLQAGEYIFNKKITPYQLLMSLNIGMTTQSSITFIEGHNFKQMRERILKNDALKHTIHKMSDAELLRALNADYRVAEGLFFPSTYYFSRGTTDLEILERSYREMQKRLLNSWQKRALGLPYNNPYEALIMASIIEKETALAQERTVIAGVFLNRLKVGMRLQTDPTVIYGMGERYHGNIRKKDLLHDTPYNTYTRNGLPPTPIAMPGMAALEAALHPALTSALYFVSIGGRSHVFSKNISEHNRAVARFQSGQQ